MAEKKGGNPLPAQGLPYDSFRREAIQRTRAAGVIDQAVSHMGEQLYLPLRSVYGLGAVSMTAFAGWIFCRSF